MSKVFFNKFNNFSIINMPRGKQSTKQNTKLKYNNSTIETNTWIFLMKDDVLKETNETNVPNIVKLKHPATNDSSLFFFSPSNDAVQEINSFLEKKRSWFIDDSVISNGQIHISTPIDPIFLVLPYLKKHCSNQAVPLDHALKDDEYPEIERVLSVNGLKNLKFVADQKGDVELNAFKYNEGKTLLWLEKKIELVSKTLKKKNIQVSSGATSATFVRSSKEEQLESTYLRWAHGIVSEYLSDELSEKLLKHLNLPEDAKPQNASNKRKSTAPAELEDNKKQKVENNENNIKNEAEIPKLEVKTKQTATNAKQKARAKAAAGSKSINSFFKKV